MAEKNKGAIDPVAIRELISQGIPMKKKESEMIPPAAVEEMDASVSETRKEEVLEGPKLPIRTRRKNLTKGDYISLFMHRNDLYDRKAIYISKELQDKLSEIVLFIRKREMTLGMYVENILLKHLEDYKEEINRLSEKNFKKLL
ncbi:hypothetical protein CS546_08780 [Porphyromonas gingivalis]|uniref:DUF3408 domain-containing protein n=1 Tax=Porphyromonas gingivalis TaxID=837 RepID=UPI000C1962A0|nr:DUF3408 domain-containing protein [Porphyromonas gingivalis]ATR95099.1 hypothetical protein CS546_08780 [Porphyromonas gingivalis]ATR96360.1 hypothetical protein CS548_04260 [Porphyromonas gingivalis]